MNETISRGIINKMKILGITMGQYPSNDAASQRLHLLLSMLAEKGHEVEVVSRNRKTACGEIGIIRYESSYSSPKGKIGIIRDVFISFPNFVKKKVVTFKPNVILLFSSPSSVAYWLLKKRKAIDFRIIQNSVEWYSKEEYRFPYFSYDYLKKQFWMRHLLPKRFDIIAISQYLERYFIGCGNRCIRIPSVCEIEAINYNFDKMHEKLTISYAGTPGKKDRFREIILALHQLEKDELHKLQLCIIGATKEQIASNAQIPIEMINELGESIKFFGRIAREEVYKHLAESDFTILIRPERARYAMAGFPTKVPESLAAVTPVVCNLTSDLGLYLNDENAIIVREDSTEAVLVALRKIIALDQETLYLMKKNARKTAELVFDYRLYSDILNKFVRGEE